MKDLVDNLVEDLMKVNEQVNFFNKRIQFLLIQFMINPFQWCIAMQICIPILYTKMDMGQALRGREKNKQKTEIITLKLTPSLDFNENSQIGTITSNSVQGDKRRVQYCRYIILGQFDSQKIEVQRLKPHPHTQILGLLDTHSKYICLILPKNGSCLRFPHFFFSKSKQSHNFRFSDNKQTKQKSAF